MFLVRDMKVVFQTVKYFSFYGLDLFEFTLDFVIFVILFVELAGKFQCMILRICFF